MALMCVHICVCNSCQRERLTAQIEPEVKFVPW